MKYRARNERKGNLKLIINTTERENVAHRKKKGKGGKSKRKERAPRKRNRAPIMKGSWKKASQK